MPRWCENPQLRQFYQYLVAEGLNATYSSQICQRVNWCIEKAGGDTDQVSGCNPRDFVNVHYKGTDCGYKGHHVGAIRWFQAYLTGGRKPWRGPYKHTSIWQEEPLMIRFGQYVQGAGKSRLFGIVCCRAIYALAHLPRTDSVQLGDDPVSIVNARFGERSASAKEKAVLAIKWFDRFLRVEAGISEPVKAPKPATVKPRPKSWSKSPLMVQFRAFLRECNLSEVSADTYCRAVHDLAHASRTEPLPAEYDLKAIVDIRYSMFGTFYRAKAVRGVNWFDWFLKFDGTAPKPVVNRYGKQGRRLPLSERAARAEEMAMLSRFDTYLQAHEEPAQYAQGICRALSKIHRESKAGYEILATCDPEPFVSQHYPRMSRVMQRSRVATIRRFQEFMRASEQVQQHGGVLA